MKWEGLAKLPGDALYWLTTVVIRLYLIVMHDPRRMGYGNWPSKGGALVCANHQSYVDPILIGGLCPRPMSYLARDTLFRWPPFARLLSVYHAIPLQREGLGIGGLKESLKRLKRGELLLIFPEGTRTRDGELQALQPGFCALARRGKVPIVPVGIDGPYAMWPRSRTWPRWTGVGIRVVIGESIQPETISSLSDEELVRELRRRLAACVERGRGKPPGGMVEVGGD